jgi:hypothetical protein
MRVWFLNGRYSVDLRQGEIAQTITRIAEMIETSRSESENAGSLEPVFRVLWAIASEHLIGRPTARRQIHMLFERLFRPRSWFH